MFVLATRADADPWWVVCLCAEWCGVCREWSATFRALRERFPQLRFAWVDVEDEDDAMGDVDIETFPTLLVAQGGQVRFFGPVQPSAVQVERLLDNLLQGATSGAAITSEATALMRRLEPVLLRKS